MISAPTEGIRTGRANTVRPYNRRRSVYTRRGIMNEIQKEINNAYKMLSSLLVSGDQVDVVAAVKLSLRRAFQMAKDEAQKDEAQKDEAQKEE